MYMPPASYPGPCRYSSPSTLGVPKPSCGAPHSRACWSADRQGATTTAFEPPCDSTRSDIPVLRIVLPVSGERRRRPGQRGPADPGQAGQRPRGRGLLGGGLARGTGRRPGRPRGGRRRTGHGGRCGGVVDPARVVEDGRGVGGRVGVAAGGQFRVEVLQEAQVLQLAAATAAELPGQVVADGHGVGRAPAGRAVRASQPERLAQREELIGHLGQRARCRGVRRRLIGVDPVGKRDEGAAGGLGECQVLGAQLGRGVEERADRLVLAKLRGAENGRQRALDRPPGQLELDHPVLRLRPARAEPDAGHRVRVDARHPVGTPGDDRSTGTVADDLSRRCRRGRGAARAPGRGRGARHQRGRGRQRRDGRDDHQPSGCLATKCHQRSSPPRQRSPAALRRHW